MVYTLVRHYSAAPQASAEKIRRDRAKDRNRKGVYAYYEIRYGDKLTTVCVRNDRTGVRRAVLRLVRGGKREPDFEDPPASLEGGYVFLRFGSR